MNKQWFFAVASVSHWVALRPRLVLCACWNRIHNISPFVVLYVERVNMHIYYMHDSGLLRTPLLCAISASCRPHRPGATAAACRAATSSEGVPGKLDWAVVGTGVCEQKHSSG